MNDRTQPQPPAPLLSPGQMDALKQEIRVIIHGQIRAQLEAERSRAELDAAARRRLATRHRRSPRDRYKNRRRGHCPNCGEIRIYTVFAKAGKRLRDQKCQSLVCGATLGRGANRRALDQDELLSAARDEAQRAKNKANRRSGSGSSGARSGGMQRVNVRDVLPLDLEHSDAGARVDATGTRI